MYLLMVFATLSKRHQVSNAFMHLRSVETTGS